MGKPQLLPLKMQAGWLKKPKTALVERGSSTVFETNCQILPMLLHQCLGFSMASFPIAVIDTGVGGLSVVQAIRRLLPHEDVHYYADTAICPMALKAQN